MEKFKNTNYYIIAVAIFLGIIIISVILWNVYKNTDPYEFKKYNNADFNSNMNIALSLEDEITYNTAWCGTFNLIWNDLKNDLAKQNIVFTPQTKTVENLNKGTFNTSCLSEESYYKVYGKPTLELKKQIEKDIKEKFDETSEILDDFSWGTGNPKDYFLYSMLKKEFKFPQVFTKLDNGTFGEYQNVKYFGINSLTDTKVRDQVIVLYYNSKDDFAIKLTTMSNDEVIISRGNKEKTFGKIYDEIQNNSNDYNGDITFQENDKLQIPNIDFKIKKEFDELENKTFSFANGDEYSIQKALQTIEFQLDEKGGKIKSEAGMQNRATAAKNDKTRYFIVDNTFCIFLKEKDKSLPYFAAEISDISKIQ